MLPSVSYTPKIFRKRILYFYSQKDIVARFMSWQLSGRLFEGRMIYIYFGTLPEFILHSQSSIQRVSLYSLSVSRVYTFFRKQIETPVRNYATKLNLRSLLPRIYSVPDPAFSFANPHKISLKLYAFGGFTSRICRASSNRTEVSQFRVYSLTRTEF